MQISILGKSVRDEPVVRRIEHCGVQEAVNEHSSRALVDRIVANWNVGEIHSLSSTAAVWLGAWGVKINDRAAKSVRNVPRRLGSSPRLAMDFNLVVVGRFNRGKTSLMNAIMGTNGLPTGFCL